MCLGENDSHMYPNMRAKFGCDPTVVSKKGGGYRQTKGHCSFVIDEYFYYKAIRDAWMGEWNAHHVVIQQFYNPNKCTFIVRL